VVVGLLGDSDYTSHYAAVLNLVDAEDRQKHPILLSQGVPMVGNVTASTPQYFMISLDDPHAEKLTIQLTTIHGDPDMFVSTMTKYPSKEDYERRSTWSGIYPDLVVYERG